MKFEWEKIITSSKAKNVQEILILVKFVMCTLVSRVHMTFYIPTIGYTLSGNQGKYDELDQVRSTRTQTKSLELSGSILPLTFKVQFDP